MHRLRIRITVYLECKNIKGHGMAKFEELYAQFKLAALQGRYYQLEEINETQPEQVKALIDHFLDQEKKFPFSDSDAHIAFLTWINDYVQAKFQEAIAQTFHVATKVVINWMSTENPKLVELCQKNLIEQNNYSTDDSTESNAPTRSSSPLLFPPTKQQNDSPASLADDEDTPEDERDDNSPGFTPAQRQLSDTFKNKRRCLDNSSLSSSPRMHPEIVHISLGQSPSDPKPEPVEAQEPDRVFTPTPPLFP